MAVRGELAAGFLYVESTVSALRNTSSGDSLF
jgi:hypothetical protein